MNNTVRRGALIVFEGCDRVGKTTQCQKLVESLKADGLPAVLLRFPERSTPVGQVISSYLQGKSTLEDHAIHLLFSANRWELVPKMLKLLSSGTNVIVDRYAFSGAAFSAAKQGMELKWCKQADVGLPKPDLVIFLELPLEIVEQRGGFGNERYEKREFQARVRENYDKLKGDNWKVINADQTPEELHTVIKQQVMNTFNTLEHDLRLLWKEKS